MNSEAFGIAWLGCRKLWECREPFCWSDEASGQEYDMNGREGVNALCRRRSSSPFVIRSPGALKRKGMPPHRLFTRTHHGEAGAAHPSSAALCSTEGRPIVTLKLQAAFQRLIG